MEENFFERNNFDLLLSVANDEINKKDGVFMEISSLRQSLYNNMEEVFSTKNANDSLDTLNKVVLIKTVEFAFRNASIELDDSLIKMATTDALFSEAEKDLTNNAVFDNLQSIVESERTSTNVIATETMEIDENLNPDTYNLLETDPDERRNDISITENTDVLNVNLDICSGDRNVWQSENSPYSFSVQFGSSDTFGGISVPDIIKNVFEVSVCNMLVANSNTELSRYPYLYIEIKELQNNIVSTSEHGRKSFVKLIRDKIWKESEESNVVYYLMQDKCIEFKNINVPIASLSRLTINIISPYGNIISPPRDVFEITHISEDNEKILLKLKYYFTMEEISKDNRIKISGVNFDNVELNQFLLDNEHYISDISNQSSGGMWNQIEIGKETQLDLESGNINYPSYGMTSNWFGVTNGKFMNLSLQTNMSIVLKCRKTALNYMTQIV